MEILTFEDVEFIAYEAAQELMSHNEPIPDFKTRFPNILESCVATPFQTFHGKPLYDRLIKRAAILFYLLIKNHPFQNGNKRIAVMTLLVFLYKNKKWIKADSHEFYNFAVWIAESPAEVKDHTVGAIEDFIAKHLVSVK